MKRKMLSILLALCMVCSLLPVTAMADPASEPTVTIGNHGYPYGKTMISNPTLVVDATLGNGQTPTYQWCCAANKGDSYTEITGATAAELLLSPAFVNKWVKCSVNGTDSEAVLVITGEYNSALTYYISNGTMAYSWIDGNEFDVRGYISDSTVPDGWLNTSYNHLWEIHTSSTAPDPTDSALSFMTPPGGNDSTEASLVAFKGFFSDSDIYTVYLEATIGANEQAFAFGCDIKLAGYDYSPLTAVKNNKGEVTQIQLVGIDSSVDLKDAPQSAPSMVIRTPQAPSHYWLGGYSSRKAFVDNTDANGVVDQVQGLDSGMTVSWTNLAAGSTIPFEFSVGTVGQTGASLGEVAATGDTITIKNSKTDQFYRLTDANGNPVTGVTYMGTSGDITPDANGWFAGNGGDIVISGLAAGMTYKIVAAANVGNNPAEEGRTENSITTLAYTVSFNATVGTGTMDPISNVYGAYTLPACGFSAPEGKQFKGWALTADGAVITTASIDVTAATTLYAIWEDATTTPTPNPQPPVYYPSVDPTPVIPSVDVDIHDDTLSDAAKAVGSAVKSGKADFTPVAGYTKEDVIQMQKDNALKLVVEKKSSYDPAEKSLIDTAAQEKGKAPLVQFLEIDVTLRTMNDVIVAEVDDTVVPLSITVDLNAEMQKAAKEGKTIYVARAHDGKVAFLEGTLNADKTKVTFDSSKFSTYALVASDSQTVTSPQTADAGIFLAVSMSVLSVTGSAVLLKKKED